MKNKKMEKQDKGQFVKDIIKSIVNRGSDKCVRCGTESDYGAHGLNAGEIYSVYYCEKHYFSMKRGSA